ncbi:HAMP domain-containing sensor histidine kinase [Lebetimonas sp. JH292]|uniref:sensor histidine kinase n=1 Tax=Lebetimonas sp. JH292 TaxID=990068 RepID=UPI0004BAF22F|nr:HAMP domain-containing sensor histidine kinase [Lebetimonas sp. JH292]
MGSIVYIQYYKSEQILRNNFINKHKIEALKIKDKFKNIFDKALYIYKIHEQLNIKNTFKLNKFYKNGKFNISQAAKILNSSLERGKYEIFQIDRNYKIINGTYQPDIGYDLGHFPAYKKVLDNVFNGKEKIDISYIHLDIASKNLKKYYLIRSSDGKYLLQSAYVLDIYSKLKKIYKFIKPALNNLKIYFVDRYLVYSINFKNRYQKKLSVNELCNYSKNFLLYFSNNKDIAKKSNIEILNKIVSVFKKHNNMIYKIRGNTLKIFVLINGIINNKDNRMIIETDFNLTPLKTAERRLFKNFWIIFVLMAVFIILMYFFAKKYFIKKLDLLTKAFKDNRKCKMNESFIKEIAELQTSYNKLFEKLNDEIEKNKKLLYLNRRFVVDTIHQIRTPLNVILLNVELLRESCREEEILDEIEASVSMLSNSYEDLAYISSNNVVEYKPENIDIALVLKERIEYFFSIAKSHNKNFLSDIDENCIFNINKIELERVIDNNISNAVKYSKGKEIIVSLKKYKNKFVLKFETYGEKIKDSKNIFEKNYREQPHKRGLGIGLNIVKKICEKYNIKYSHFYQNEKNIFEYQFLVKF